MKTNLLSSILIFILINMLSSKLLGEDEFIPGAFFVKKVENGVSVSNNNTLILKNGYTFSSENPCKIRTDENSELNLILSNGIIINFLSKTEASIDMFYMSVKNLANPPEKVDYSFSISQFSIMSGKIEIYVPTLETNSHVLVQSPLAIFNISGGKYFVDTGPMHVIIGVLEGMVEITTDKKKVERVESNNMALIIPHPGKENRILVTQKPLSDEEKNRKNNISENQLKNIIFAVIDKKIVGIKY